MNLQTWLWAEICARLRERCSWPLFSIDLSWPLVWIEKVYRMNKHTLFYDSIECIGIDFGFGILLCSHDRCIASLFPKYFCECKKCAIHCILRVASVTCFQKIKWLVGFYTICECACVSQPTFMQILQRMKRSTKLKSALKIYMNGKERDRTVNKWERE